MACLVCFKSITVVLLGRKLEEDGIEDNGLEDDFGDGQVWP